MHSSVPRNTLATIIDVFERKNEYRELGKYHEVRGPGAIAEIEDRTRSNSPRFPKHSFEILLRHVERVWRIRHEAVRMHGRSDVG